MAYTTEAPVFGTAVTSRPDGGSSADVEDKDCRSIGRSQESREAIAAAIQKLGVRLLQNLETTPEQPNVIISPFSISLALSQLSLGMHVLLQLIRDTFSLNSLYFYTYIIILFDELCQQLAQVYSHLETVTVLIQLLHSLFTGAVNETLELLMHHLHEHSLPCYHESLHNVLVQLRNNDLQIATRIFMRQGYFLKINIKSFLTILKVETAQTLLAETFISLSFLLLALA